MLEENIDTRKNIPEENKERIFFHQVAQNNGLRLLKYLHKDHHHYVMNTNMQEFRMNYW